MSVSISVFDPFLRLFSFCLFVLSPSDVFVFVYLIILYFIIFYYYSLEVKGDGLS